MVCDNHHRTGAWNVLQAFGLKLHVQIQHTNRIVEKTVARQTHPLVFQIQPFEVGLTGGFFDQTYDMALNARRAGFGV